MQIYAWSFSAAVYMLTFFISNHYYYNSHIPNNHTQEWFDPTDKSNDNHYNND